MQAIETRYLGPTNTRGSRIVATTHSAVSRYPVRLTVPFDHTLSTEAGHRKAAEALKAKLGWKGRMVGGGTRTGYCFVFVDGAA